MARKNRVSVYDGVYHVTTRIANRAMLLGPSEVKERLMKWIVSIANFSGVEVWGFTVMDNVTGTVPAGPFSERHRDCPRRAIFRKGYAPAQRSVKWGLVKWGLSPAQRAGCVPAQPQRSAALPFRSPAPAPSRLQVLDLDVRDRDFLAAFAFCSSPAHLQLISGSSPAHLSFTPLW